MQTYREYLDAAGAPSLDHVDRRHDGRFDARCPSCGGLAHPAVIWDVSELDASVTGGVAWACDACWLAWKREMRPFEAGDDFVVPEEWEHKWFEKIGRWDTAKKAAHAQVVLIELGKKRADCDRWIAEGIDVVRSQALRDKIHARAGIPAAADKTAIAANGVDGATITGIPAGSMVAVDDGVAVEVVDGSVVIKARAVGRYKVRIEKDGKLPEEIFINAG